MSLLWTDLGFPKVDPRMYHVDKNKRISNRVLSVFKTHHMPDCASMCNLINSCRSFNYKKDYTCEISNGSAKEHLGNLVDDVDSDYYEAMDI